jgi:hypothetical protein
MIESRPRTSPSPLESNSRARGFPSAVGTRVSRSCGPKLNPFHSGMLDVVPLGL